MLFSNDSEWGGHCGSYALFPLLVLLDAAVAGRSSNSYLKAEFSTENNMVRVGDRVAEGVLSCVETILRRCYLETTSQVVNSPVELDLVGNGNFLT